jgi:hypothetical protein
MHFQPQSPEHERSYRLACKALAHARGKAYATAAAMTTPELRACATDYAVNYGRATGEALTQLRMVRTIIAHRTRSTRSRSRAMPVPAPRQLAMRQVRAGRS